ncbi:MAG: FkbM family methyltransferase [Sphingomonadaceae bacterium]|nr:FkbM family methyltransferase [Sphingomonadaceae bacterium]
MLAQLDGRRSGRAVYVGDNRLLVAIIVGGREIAYFVEANDRLITPMFVASGRYEKAPTRYLLQHLRRDSHCIDVGCNFGYFACLMARFAPAGRIVAVEPEPGVFGLARDNIAANGFLDSARVLNVAAGAARGAMTLHRRDTRSGNTSLYAYDDHFAASFGERPATAFAVECVPVDELAQELGGRVDFLKVDVEGAEQLVLQGAERTIGANPRISILMEWSPGQMEALGFGTADFLAYLDGLGLEAYDLQITSRRPIAYADLARLRYRAAILLRHRSAKR